jgi:Xaa-Pro aminopeptidase
MKLEAIQQALRTAGLDGWLFCDHHHRDPMAYKILGLDAAGMTSRRWFYFIPAQGEPGGLAHRVEPRKLQGLPGRIEHFTAWTELHAKLRALLGAPRKIAMQYSPNNDIPYIGLVDAGTIDLVRSFGHEVATSADLVQTFEAATGQEGFDSHAWAGARVQRIKDEAFALMDRSLRDAKAISEYDILEYILRRFEEEGLTSDGEVPIVGFNDHPADPHFEPTRENAHTLKKGDTILLDLWARRIEPVGIYYDITWCAFAGPEPPAEYRKIFGIAVAGRDAAVDLVRSRLDAGRPVAGWEVDDACRKVVVDAGYGERFVHRTGHSIGTSVHGNGVNIDNLETRDTRMIVPGVCFSIEPGIYLDGRMAVRTEIDVFVTPAGRPEIVGPVQHALVLLA